MSKVIIAEKPSVARNIAEAIQAKTRRDGYFEGQSYYVTWAFGHLLELYDSKDYDEKMTSWRMENFPFIPDAFKYKVKADGNDRHRVDEGAAKQLQIIDELIKKEDVTGVISACDYDREGQIIGDIILEYLGVEKTVQRLLLNEWTPDEVLSGLEKLVINSEMSPLRDAGISRQWADWIIGINLTSVATLKYQRGAGKALNIGRVLLPTLKIIYDRDMEIENFVREEYHKLTAEFKTVAGETYTGVYTEDGNDKFEDKTKLEELKKEVLKKVGIVTTHTVETKREYPPSLFNLSGLQGYVTGKQKGWTSEKVLKVAQSLYEKKLITYPRTASMALEESLIDKAAKVLNVHKKGLPYEKEIEFHTNKRVFDNAKVESHSAIIPTYVVGKGLSPDEKVVYDAVKNRFVMQFMPVAEHEEITIITEPAERGVAVGTFVSKGRRQLIEGWRQVEKIKSKENDLPSVSEGESVTFEKVKIETKGTNPPKRHTEKTLLKVMETCGKKYKNQTRRQAEASEDEEDSDEEELESGIDADEEEDQEMIASILSGFSIGTPATRAETIMKLKRVGYIAVKGKSLYCTDMGKKLVEVFPVKSLFDLEYTGRLEKTLSDIGKGEIQKDDFLKAITEFTEEAVEGIKGDAFHIIQNLEEPHENSLGKCPECGADVIEGKRGYGCTNWKGGCKFVIWKEDKFLKAIGVSPTRHAVMRLLENGDLYSSSFVNKKGQKFSAYLTYEKNEETGYYSWKMTF